MHLLADFVMDKRKRKGLTGGQTELLRCLKTLKGGRLPRSDDDAYKDDDDAWNDARRHAWATLAQEKEQDLWDAAAKAEDEDGEHGLRRALWSKLQNRVERAVNAEASLAGEGPRAAHAIAGEAAERRRQAQRTGTSSKPGPKLWATPLLQSCNMERVPDNIMQLAAKAKLDIASLQSVVLGGGKKLPPWAVEPAAGTCCWDVSLTSETSQQHVTELGKWHAKVQKDRTFGSGVPLTDGRGAVVCTLKGYQKYTRTHSRAAKTDKQEILTLDIWSSNGQLDLARAHIPGFAGVADELQALLRQKTGLAVQLVKAHGLDQEGLPTKLCDAVAETKTEQSGFGPHIDTDEEFEGSKNTAVCTILATVVVRVDNFGSETGMAVCGFDAVSYAGLGSAVAFASALWHYTTSRGGLKWAFFFGWPLPNIHTYERYKM